MLDQAFDALKTYDWGTDRSVLNPIDEAVIASHGNTAQRAALEKRLAEQLAAELSRDAKDFLCRTLMIVGTAASVPALARLLPEKEHSHMARFALERIPDPAAGQALREALPNVDGPLKIGVISSLGVRKDTASVAALAALLLDADSSVACAAAYALGDICTPDAAKALSSATSAGKEVRLATTDASLACAERLLADGKKAEALKIYKSLVADDQPKHIRLAGTRGMLACAGKKE